MEYKQSLKEQIERLDKDIDESQRIFDSGNIGKRDEQIKKIIAEWGAEIGFREGKPTLRTALLNEHLESYIKQMENYRLSQLEKLNNIQNNQAQITNIQVGDGNQAINAKNSSDIKINNNPKQSIFGRIVAYVLGFLGIGKS